MVSHRHVYSVVKKELHLLLSVCQLLFGGWQRHNETSASIRTYVKIANQNKPRDVNTVIPAPIDRHLNKRR